MKLVAMEFRVVEQQGDWLEKANEVLRKAVTVVMYASDASANYKDLHIFAIVED